MNQSSNLAENIYQLSEKENGTVRARYIHIIQTVQNVSFGKNNMNEKILELFVGAQSLLSRVRERNEGIEFVEIIVAIVIIGTFAAVAFNIIGNDLQCEATTAVDRVIGTGLSGSNPQDGATEACATN